MLWKTSGKWHLLYDFTRHNQQSDNLKFMEGKKSYEKNRIGIKAEFSKWDGCELHKIAYSSDEECNADNISWMNQLEEGNDAKETFTQCIMFTSEFHSPKKGGGAWNPDQEYTGWQWWLARADGGQWKLMTWGY